VHSEPTCHDHQRQGVQHPEEIRKLKLARSWVSENTVNLVFAKGLLCIGWYLLISGHPVRISRLFTPTAFARLGHRACQEQDGSAEKQCVEEKVECNHVFWRGEKQRQVNPQYGQKDREP